MLVTIMGSSGSGKSTFAIKLAKAYAEQKKNTLVVFSDYYAPSFVTFFPEEVSGGSLGRLLAQPVLTKELIHGELSPVKASDYIVFLGYQAGENKYQYANYTKQKAEDLLIALKYLADVVIFDGMASFYEDILTQTAVEMADTKIAMIKADLKGLSYYKSNVSFFGQGFLLAVSDPDESNLSLEVAEEMGQADFLLPYTAELKKQFLEERMFEKLSRQGKEYETVIHKVIAGIS